MNEPPSFEAYQRHLDARLTALDAPLRAALRALKETPLHPEVDLLQFEFIHEQADAVFPILRLTKRRSDGPDFYTYGQSYDPRRACFYDADQPQYLSGPAGLLDEPLINDALRPYYLPDNLDDDLIERCDVHFFEAVCAWFLSAWAEVIEAPLSAPAYFLRMGDDADGTVFDLAQRREVPWLTMYAQA
ncbi:hypothetical protein KKF91_04040 [Myxococcota bacterium]|nr:hypothetical protein [Myxococcota bacterium]